MMKKLTEEEKRKNIIENVKSNIFVEAGAGAGKTTLIVSRVLNQLKTGAVKAGELVIITFTNKAAEELYIRIEGALRKELEKAGLDEAEKKNLDDALSNLENMNISTIHSFCYKLLQEYAFDIKLPLVQRILIN